VHPELRPLKKFMAASVPRFLRASRLSYLPLKCIIGSWRIEIEDDINLVFNVVMLPADEFTRAKSYLATPTLTTPSLHYGRFAPAYGFKDTKEIIVPADEADPENYAKAYFLEAFNLPPGQGERSI
jgi:hypothetical protein